MTTKKRKPVVVSPCTLNVIVAAEAERIVHLSGDVDEERIAAVTEKLLSLSGSPEPILLFVSTYGGSVDEMFGLYDLIKFLPQPIYTIGLGKIMSAGVLILAAGEKGHRAIGQTSSVMLHSAQGELCGTTNSLMNEVSYLDDRQSLLKRKLIAESRLTLKKLDEIVKSGNNVYFTADDVIKWGLADHIL